MGDTSEFSALVFELNHPAEEIIEFFNNVFELAEIRGTVGTANGIQFIVHSNETNHHVHAEYGEFAISIRIADGKVLANKNMPAHNVKKAVTWVIDNREKLQKDWKDLAISENSSLTKSTLIPTGKME